MAKARNAIEDHIESQMKIIAPNVAAILGTAVGARLLAKAGSIKKMATLPASTIQVLGAEKALFRALKTGTQPPKHGILFQHPIVHAAPRWQRGKMARAIASKAAIAARVDVYGAGLNQTLLDKLNIRVKEIGEKYKEPTEGISPTHKEVRREFGRKDQFRSRDSFRSRDDRPRESRGFGKRDSFSSRDDRPRDSFRSRDDRPRESRGFGKRDSFSSRDDRPRDSFRNQNRDSIGERDSRRDGFRSRGESDTPRREFRGDSSKRKKFGKRRF
jgi:nucleolar protein 56